jgi:hypothetical protein
MPLRNIFRFRLSSLLVLVTIVSIVLGWYVVNRRQYDAELQALGNLHIRPSGYAAVPYDNDNVLCGMGLGRAARMRWHGPNWIRKPLEWWGAPIFYRTEQIAFTNLAIDEIDELGRLKHLARIEIYDEKVTHDLRLRLREKFPRAYLGVTLVTQTGVTDPIFGD